MISYAIANLEHAKGTLLRYNNVNMEEGQLPPEWKIAIRESNKKF